MFSAKKLLLIGFIVVLLIAIPVTVYLLQQQQQLESQAQAATTLEFEPTSTPSNPIQVQVGDPVDLDIWVTPNTNAASFVKLEIQYDSTKLAIATSSGDQNAFEANTVTFPSPRGEPDFSVDGKVVVSLSVGPLPTAAVKTRAKVGTLHFAAKEKTDTPTQVIFGLQSQVLSVAETDQASEDVLDKSALKPAIINIVAPAEEPTPTDEVPTDEEPTEEPTPPDEVTPSASPTATTNQIPSCVALTADIASGAAPLTVKFTGTGSDSDGTISKISFNFGDGNVTSVTEGLGTASASATTSHTYTGGGTFTASAVMTDNASGTSTNTCSQTIIVSGPTATPTATMTPTATPTSTIAGTDTPTPTIESPGPGATIIGLGAFFTVLSIIGAALFFTL